MPSQSISGSPDIVTLDSKIVADLCAGKFYVDLTPSVYIGSGADNVQGAKVRITNPYGIVIKDYADDFEIYPALSGGMNTVIPYNIPTQAGSYQYGAYTVDVKLTDSEGNEYTVTKTVNICEPDMKNKQRNYGSLSATMNGVCSKGKLYIVVDSIPNYKGKTVESKSAELELKYPTASEVPPLQTSLGTFSVILYEGEYILTGEICATYNMGDNIYVKVKYKVKKKKNIRCIVDLCCVFTQLKALHNKLQSDCTQEEKDETNSIIFDALRLVFMIQQSAECENEDSSEYITDLEKLLGCSCTCNCAEGAPIINTSPATDVIVQGCNVEEEVAGLTKTYTIENYSYTVSYNDNGGILTVAAATTNDCNKDQKITFNVVNAYLSVKAQANASNTEADSWAAIINKALRDINPSCLGLTNLQWQNKTYAEKFDAVFQKMCACCGCTAAVSGIEFEQSGADIKVTWTNNAGVFLVRIYIDGVFVGEVLADLQEFTLLDAAGGDTKTITLIPCCSNGEFGTKSEQDIHYTGCPEVAPPSLSSNLFESVQCPFDLEAALALTPGDYELHNMNNTLASSLVGNPNAVNDGEYWVFARQAAGAGYCYSVGQKVTVLCGTAESCTAPQNLQSYFGADTPGGILQYFRFNSALYPPPGNSYTAKKRLASDPDVPGSYTTLGTPTFNAGANKWEFTDLLNKTTEVNKKWVYRVESNCGGSPATTPYIDLTFVYFRCAPITATPGADQMGYSFTTSYANEVTKYEVSIYDETGTILLHTNTHLPAFSNPLTGTFDYLEPGTDYIIRVKAFIGSTSSSSTCEQKLVTTSGVSVTLNNAADTIPGDNIVIQNVTIDGNAITGVTYPVVPGGGATGGGVSNINASIAVTVSGTTGTTVRVVDSLGALHDQAYSGAGVYNFAGINCTSILSVILL